MKIMKTKYSNTMFLFGNLSKLLISGLIFIVLALFIVVTSPVYLLRVLVILLARIFRSDLGDILNGLSALLANDYFYNNAKSPRASLVISLVMEGHNLTIEQLKEMLMERWILAKNSTTGKLKFKQFQQYPVRWMGFTFWKKCAQTFNINKHVYEHGENNNEKSYLDENDVTNICEMLINKPYSQFTSPWEVHLVKNWKIENVTKNVVMFKVHHCLADGYSMLTAIVEGFCQQKIDKSILAAPKFKRRSILEQLMNYVCFPFNVFCEFSYVLSKMFNDHPWKIPDDRKDWYQVCAKSDFIPIYKVKFIKTQLNVTFTSVLLSAISSGVEQSLKDLKMKKIAGKNENSIYCLSILPLPGHPQSLTNHSTATLFDLPLNKCENSVEKLRQTNFMLETSKNSCIPVFNTFYFAIMGCHFYPVGKFCGKLRMTPIGLTNFPSVPIQVEENGMKYIAADFLAGGLDGYNGVIISVMSYNGNIRVAVTAEKAIMSKEEIKRFTSYMTAEIDRLYEVAASPKKNVKALDYTS